jgi:hypothetical protein
MTLANEEILGAVEVEGFVPALRRIAPSFIAEPDVAIKWGIAKKALEDLESIIPALAEEK